MDETEQLLSRDRNKAFYFFTGSLIIAGITGFIFLLFMSLLFLGAYLQAEYDLYQHRNKKYLEL